MQGFQVGSANVVLIRLCALLSRAARRPDHLRGALREDGTPLVHSVQVKETPVTVIGGYAYPGVMTEAALKAAAKLPELAADALNRAGAVLYGSDRCSWTLRQMAIFGPHASELSYVECNRDPGACAAAGVEAVPVWVFGNSKDSKRVVGFRLVEDLLQASRDHMTEADAAAVVATITLARQTAEP